jgi:hypothetical protein
LAIVFLFFPDRMLAMLLDVCNLHSNLALVFVKLSNEKQFYIYLSQFTHEPTSSLLSKSFQIQNELSFTRDKRNYWQGHGKHLLKVVGIEK